MADYAPNYTPRLKMRYSCQSRNHIAVVRLPRDTSEVEADAVSGQLTDALNTFGLTRLYTDWTVIGWEYCHQDSSVFLPRPTPDLIAGGASVTGRPVNQIAMQATFPYRTDAGGHGFFCLYGTNFNVYGGVEQDFRVTSAEQADVSELALVGGDNANPVFRPYCNIGFNARWKRRVRNG